MESEGKGALLLTCGLPWTGTRGMCMSSPKPKLELRGRISVDAVAVSDSKEFDESEPSTGRNALRDDENEAEGSPCRRAADMNCSELGNKSIKCSPRLWSLAKSTPRSTSSELGRLNLSVGCWLRVCADRWEERGEGSAERGLLSFIPTKLTLLGVGPLGGPTSCRGDIRESPLSSTPSARPKAFPTAL